MIRFARDLPKGGSRRRWAISAGLLLVVGWTFYRSFFPESSPRRVSDLLEGALFDPQAVSPEFAFLVFILLLFHRRSSLKASLGIAPVAWAAFVSFSLSFALSIWAVAVGAPDLGRLSFVFGAIGTGYFLGGVRLVKILGFPLIAVVLSVPLPLAMTNQFLLPLQLATSDLASTLLTMLGQAHVHHGDQIVRGGIAFHVIEGCSGFRSIFNLTLAAVLLADTSCRGAAEKFLFLMLAPIVAFLMNGLRVVVLILREVPSDAPEHVIQGLLMIVLGVVVLALIERFAYPKIFSRSRREEKREAPGFGSGPSQVAAVDARLGWLGLIGLSLLVGTSLAEERVRLDPPKDRLNLESIATGFDGWTITHLRRNANFLGATRFRHLTYREFQRGGERLSVFLGAEDRRDRDRFGWSPKTAIPAPAWQTVEGLQPAQIGDQRIERSLVAYPNRSILVYHWRQGYAGWIEELFRNWLALDYTPWRIEETSFVIRLETTLDGSVAGLERGDRLLREFAARLKVEIADRVSRTRSSRRSSVLSNHDADEVGSGDRTDAASNDD